MSSKKTIELDKSRKPPKGRPKSKFVSHRYHWCIPYLMFCDHARNCGKCREEAPKHTMPFPFEDFNCGKYIVIPAQDYNALQADLIEQIMQLAIIKAMEATIGFVDCEIKLTSLKIIKPQIFEAIFNIVIEGKEQTQSTKHVSVIIDIENQSAKTSC